MFVFAAITGRASRDEIVRSGKRLSGKFRCTKSRGDHRSPAELLPMRRRAYSSLPSSESMSVMYGSRTFVSLQIVFSLRAEYLSFLPKRKIPKKSDLRACALKNPLIVQSCYAQSKMSCSPLLPLRVALCRPSGEKNCTKQKKRKVGATIGRPRLRRVLP